MSDERNGPPPLVGVSLVKAPVSDIEASLTWYGKVFGGERIAALDHIDGDGRPYAYMLQLPGLPMPLQLRLAPRTAGRVAGFDPFAFAVETKADLEDWVARLDALGVLNSGVERGLVGWFLVVKDPDGLSIRIFTRERHDIEHGIPETAWTRYPAEQEGLS